VVQLPRSGGTLPILYAARQRLAETPVGCLCSTPDVTGPSSVAPSLIAEDGASARLLDAVQALSGARTLESVMVIVRTTARELTGADGATFVLREGDKVFYADESAIGPLWKGQRFPAEACVSGYAMIQREPVIIPDVYADARVPVAAYSPTFVKSMAMVPIRQDDPIGAIGAYWATHHHATPREVALVQALANAAAIALSNLELYRDLDASLSHFRTLTEAIPQMVWTTTAQGAARYFNSRWSEYTGLSAADSADFGWAEAVHPDDRAGLMERWREAVASGELYQAEARLRSADGGWRWVIARALPMRDGGGRVVEWFGTCTDIDEQKRSQEAMAETIRLRDEFISIASHELRTPLTALHLQISGLLRLMERPGSLPTEAVLSRLRKATLTTERLGRLFDELLDVSRISSGAVNVEVEDDVDLVEVVLAAVERFRESAARCLSPLQLAAPSRLTGRWDRTRLDQIVTNLLSNAVKYGAGQPIEVFVEGDDERARVTVRDHGIGIDPAQQARIFDRFERAVSPRNYGGFGLGLWITRNIVEELGGQIDLHSQPGAGASFAVTLPRAAEVKADPAG
jgi:PAS domain S-box-containing protein